jgi:S1-C subfamily serine protease/DNA-binding XRE family transcriptional regulator
METFGQKLRKLRAQRGWKAKDVAKPLEIHAAYLSQLESDRAIPSEELARRVASFFGEDADELVFLACRGARQIRDVLGKFPRSAMTYLARTAAATPLVSGGQKPMVRLIAENIDTLGPLVQPNDKALQADADAAAGKASRAMLPDVFDIVRPSIVAFASRLTAGTRPLFPPIIGTGFVVDSDGIVVTNRHVVEALQKLPAHPVTGARSDIAILWREPEVVGNGLVMPVLLVEIKAYSSITSFTTNGPFFGEDLPDIGFVQLKAREVPALQLATAPNVLRQGMDAATAGFPLGTDPFVCFGKISQLTPTLRRGIVSALLPFPCPYPHGFTLDVLSQGGASGSPVFLTDSPTVIGMVHANLPEAPNMTFAIPSRLISDALNACTNGEPLDLTGVPTLESLVKDAPRSADLRWDSFAPRNDPETNSGGDSG